MGNFFLLMAKLVNSNHVLDSNNCVELKFYVKFFSKSSNIEEFVIILFLIKENIKLEVLKYDYSQKEALHVHKYYSKNSKKEYLQNKVDVEFVINLKNEIEINFEKYINFYKQKEYI
jgi:hypothetical protein